jgi:hypothetical protein
VKAPLGKVEDFDAVNKTAEEKIDQVMEQLVG